MKLRKATNRADVCGICMTRSKLMIAALALATLPGTALRGAETNAVEPPCTIAAGVSQPTPVPQAILQAVQSLIQIRIYGFVRLDASYDTTRAQPGDKINYVLPKVNGEDDNEFNMTARYTRLGIELKGPDIGSTKIGGKLETDFDSGSSSVSPNMRLRLAYLELVNENIGSLRAGQDWDTFMTVSPREVDTGGLQYQGALGHRRPQLRLIRDIKLAEHTLLVAKVAAARTVGEDRDTGGQDDGSDAGFPTIQGNLCLETRLLTEKPTKISISGHFGTEKLDASTNGTVMATDVDTYHTYSVIGSLVFPIHSRVSLHGTIWQGENLDAYYGGIGQGINTKLNTGIAAKGGWAQILVNITRQLNWNIGYGLDLPDDSDLNAKDRSRNEIIFMCLFYTVKPVTFSVQYSNAKTCYKDADSSTDNRFQGAVCYTF